MRRGLVGVAAGLVLALAAATGVSALWRTSIPLGTTTIAVEYPAPGPHYTVEWVGAWQGVLAPGQTAYRRVKVTYLGGAPTAASLSLTAVRAFDGASFVDQVEAGLLHADDCSGSPGSGIQGDVAITANVPLDVCVRYRLKTTAPSSLQGANLAPRLTFNIGTASWVSSPWQDEATVLTDDLFAMTVPAPTAPLTCTATSAQLLVRDGYATITWPAAPGVDSYRVVLRTEDNSASQVLATIPASSARSFELRTSVQLISDLTNLLGLTNPPKFYLSVSPVLHGWASQTALSHQVTRFGLGLSLGTGGWRCGA